MKYILLAIAVVSLGLYGPSALGQDRLKLGISGGALALSGSDGFIFRDSKSQPHREFGWSVGASLYIPIGQDLHITAGLALQQEQSHFHVDREGGNTGKDELPTGQYIYRYYQVPITLAHMGRPKGRNKLVLKEFFGLAFNYGNLADPVRGALEFSDLDYYTKVTQPAKITPEFLVGVGVVTRQMRLGVFHYQISLHLDVAKNQTFEAGLYDPDENEPRVEIRELRGVKAMVSMIYYPRIHFRKKGCYRN